MFKHSKYISLNKCFFWYEVEAGKQADDCSNQICSRNQFSQSLNKMTLWLQVRWIKSLTATWKRNICLSFGLLHSEPEKNTGCAEHRFLPLKWRSKMISFACLGFDDVCSGFRGIMVLNNNYTNMKVSLWILYELNVWIGCTRNEKYKWFKVKKKRRLKIAETQSTVLGRIKYIGLCFCLGLCRKKSTSSLSFRAARMIKTRGKKSPAVPDNVWGHDWKAFNGKLCEKQGGDNFCQNINSTLNDENVDNRNTKRKNTPAGGRFVEEVQQRVEWLALQTAEGSPVTC